MPSEGRTDEAEEARAAASGPSPDDLAALGPMVRIGVTGHRDLADREQAETDAAKALCDLLAALESAKWPAGIIGSIPHSPGTVGYRIVSPIAEGGDRAVAALVLSASPGLAARPRELVVPLPFRLAEYRGRDGLPGTDCHDAESQAEFDRLQSAAWWVRPLHPGAPGGPDQRNNWYRDVGTYVVTHCDFLFALWDGQDNGLQGGTADIVKFAVRHGTPVIWIPVVRKEAVASSAAPGDGEAKLLVGPADSDGRPALVTDLSSPQAAAILAGRDAAQPAARLVLERFARTAEVFRYAQRNRHLQQSVAEQMPALGKVPAEGAAAVQAVSEWIIPAYVIADGLARRNQRRLKVLNIGVYAAASAAVALGAFAAILFPYRGNWRIPVICEAVVLVALFLVQWLDIRRKCRDQWVTFRTMSEYFRMGRFLALATPTSTPGLEFSRFAQLYSRSRQAASVPWFSPVVERMWEHRPDLTLRDSDAPWLAAYLSAEWIDDQITYHCSRASVHLSWDTIFRRIIKVVLLATVLIVISHVILDFLPQHGGSRPTENERDVVSLSLAFVAIALTSLAAAFNGYSGLQRHGYHSVRFGYMAAQLEDINKLMGEAKTLEDVRKHLREARRIMLGESIDWYEDMEQQVLESPT